ncbi:hypothetical protein V866_004642 [Kwoniella sp. B9012]|uniref:Phosphatidylglycerol/phosphatidylinositol transfer protein n=1 Tax=Kwoniella europaea PYCC6329 TaxID=1423913 RepID=A0AAX4KJI7_9TREE
MHTSTLLSLLPLLAGIGSSPAMALPHHQQQPKLPLPALLRRQAQGQGALDLPPSLNMPTASLSSSITDDIQPTPVPVDLPSLWQINTIPQTLLAQAQPQEESVTSSPAASVTSSGDLYVQDAEDSEVTPTPTAVNMATVEYQGDSLLQPTSISMAMAGMDMNMSTNTNTNMDMDITAAAAAAITSMVGNLPSGINGNSGTITSFASSTSTVSSPTTSSAGTGASMTSMVSTTSSSSAIVSATATVAEAAGITSTSTSTSTSIDTSPTPSTSASDDKSKKIRYKHCSDTKGTVTEIKVNPCEGGKGTILDPCHFQAGKNYTITLTYVSPEDSTSPRANLVARDKTMSDGQQHFTYPGQSFDACQYTSCPITIQETKSYTYEFVTTNNRFDQLTFNMTNGLDGDSLMCAYFPVTFMPSLAGRSMGRNVPFGGLGARW